MHAGPPPEKEIKKHCLKNVKRSAEVERSTYGVNFVNTYSSCIHVKIYSFIFYKNSFTNFNFLL